MKRLILIVNFLALALFVLSAYNPFFSLETTAIAGFLGVLFPYSLLLLCLCMALDFLLLPRFALLVAVILTLHYKQISVLIAPHLFASSFKTAKKENTLRVATWNVRRFQPLNSNNIYDLELSIAHKTLIEQYQPDILCLQEFCTQKNPKQKKYDILNYFQKEFHYPYTTYQADYYIEDFGAGDIILSKYKIIRSRKIHLIKRNNATPVSLIYADILYRKDTLRIFNTHLQSYGLKKRDYQNMPYISAINAPNKELWLHSKDLLQKIRTTFLIRKQQAEHIRSEIQKSPYPVIIMGDFNDVPVSYTYFTIRGENLRDAFLDRGWGFGSTYTEFLPLLRIDYILCTQTFKVLQSTVIKNKISDHLPIIADMEKT